MTSVPHGVSSLSVHLRVSACVFVLRALPSAHFPHIWLVSPYHTQQRKLSGFPTTEFQPAEMFPHFCPPLLVSKNPADIVLSPLAVKTHSFH